MAAFSLMVLHVGWQSMGCWIHEGLDLRTQGCVETLLLKQFRETCGQEQGPNMQNQPPTAPAKAKEGGSKALDGREMV